MEGRDEADQIQENPNPMTSQENPNSDSSSTMEDDMQVYKSEELHEQMQSFPSNEQPFSITTLKMQKSKFANTNRYMDDHKVHEQNVNMIFNNTKYLPEYEQGY